MTKMRLTVVSVLSLMAACGGHLWRESEPTQAQAVMTLADVGDAEQLSIGGTCGGTVCSAGTYCCNSSCGMCAPKGASCPQISCN